VRTARSLWEVGFPLCGVGLELPTLGMALLPAKLGTTPLPGAGALGCPQPTPGRAAFK